MFTTQQPLVKTDHFDAIIQNKNAKNPSNEMKERQQSWYLLELGITFLMFGGISLVLGLHFGGVVRWPIWLIIVLCCGTYGGYIGAILHLSQIFKYLREVRQIHQFQEHCQKLKEKPGMFKFVADCYHEQVSTGSDGTTSTTNIYTYHKQQLIHPKKSIDVSERIGDLKPETEIALVHMHIRFSFSDQKSQKILNEKFQTFKIKNKKDQFQEYEKDFTIEDYIERMTFTQVKTMKYYQQLVASMIFGMIWPYSLFFERKISRYQLTFSKVVTL